MTRYLNERREQALRLLEGGCYDDLRALLVDSVMFPRLRYDEMYGWFKGHGIGRTWTEDNAH